MGELLSLGQLSIPLSLNCTKELKSNRMKKLLLVKTSSMGDLIHTFPALTDLSRACPHQYEITWVVEESFVDIAKMHPMTKEVIVFGSRRWKKHPLKRETWQEFTAFKSALRQYQWDLIVDCQGLIKSAIITRIAAQKGSIPTYSYAKESIRDPFAARFYQHGITVEKGLTAIERNRQLFAGIFHYTIDTPVAFGIQHWQTRSPLTPDRPFAALIHGTSAENKEWPEERWISIGNWLDEQGITSILFWGNEREKVRAEQLAEEIPGAILMPKVSIAEAGLILSQATLIIAVDTGFAHLANTQDRPLIGLFLGSDAHYAGVIPTASNPHAINLGGKGENPEVQEVIRAIESFQILPEYPTE